MSDKYDEDATALLWMTPIHRGGTICNGVAARLRADGERIAELKRGYTATGFEGWPCPGCVYEAGVFVRMCKLHERIDRGSERISDLEAEAK